MRYIYGVQNGWCGGSGGGGAGGGGGGVDCVYTTDISSYYHNIYIFVCFYILLFGKEPQSQRNAQNSIYTKGYRLSASTLLNLFVPIFGFCIRVGCLLLVLD